MLIDKLKDSEILWLFQVLNSKAEKYYHFILFTLVGRVDRNDCWYNN